MYTNVTQSRVARALRARRPAPTTYAEINVGYMTTRQECHIHDGRQLLSVRMGMPNMELEPRRGGPDARANFSAHRHRLHQQRRLLPDSPDEDYSDIRRRPQKFKLLAGEVARLEGGRGVSQLRLSARCGVSAPVPGHTRPPLPRTP